MMREDGDGGGGCGENSAFRWLDAVRYTVATVVTLLILTVIVVAIKVVLRPESLRLSVIGGSVSSTPLPGANAVVALRVQLRAENPSGRVRMYFFNITAYLFDNVTLAASTSDPEEDCSILFNPADMAVAQQMGAVAAWDAEGVDDPGVMNPVYFDVLYRKRRAISDVAMRVDGRLVTEVRSGINRTSHLATYYCWPLLVGGSPGDEASKSGKDVPCTEDLGNHPPDG
ncbi:hypothetical protein BAE44_0010767 [Dichanthelium oligosanthes]|uniref:Late embryogenesis abundant protein LEA-2 subgroup domain-containing protein n=1 Tax=Dichanthelium oligosanthes TaxID=888268 RepID=A0A1E5VSW4_9POAL|nr:hypothetical protein BAE44_0010767 [Dichanthelium oligosanthes]